MKTIKVREYVVGNAVIDRGEYGIDHGLSWGVWIGGKLVTTARSLKRAKRAAAAIQAAEQ